MLKKKKKKKKRRPFVQVATTFDWFEQERLVIQIQLSSDL